MFCVILYEHFFQINLNMLWKVYEIIYIYISWKDYNWVCPTFWFWTHLCWGLFCNFSLFVYRTHCTSHTLYRHHRNCVAKYHLENDWCATLFLNLLRETVLECQIACFGIPRSILSPLYWIDLNGILFRFEQTFNPFFLPYSLFLHIIIIICYVP